MARSEGDRVQWDWGDGTGTGTIIDVYQQKTTVTIKGTEVTRKASANCPAYLIEHNDGDRVLKSESEVSAA